MNIFDLFRRKRIQTKARTHKRRTPYRKVMAHLATLEKNIQMHTTLLDQHSRDLISHKTIIDGHLQRISTLEERIVTPASLLPVLPSPTVTSQPTNLPTKHSLGSFSQQEKRILAVFFQNSGMSLSYQDVATALSKSAHTVKNQLHQILIKADLFDKTVDNDSRNRFKIKDGVHVEQYLNLK